MARASALHAEGHRFDSDILHFLKPESVVVMIDVAVKAAIMVQLHKHHNGSWSQKFFDILGKQFLFVRPPRGG